MNLTNYLLIATPQINVAPFSRSVIYIYQHNVEGAVGLIINYLTEINLFEMLNIIDIKSSNKLKTIPVLKGGELHPQYGFVIHTPHGDWEKSMQMDKNITITTSQDILESFTTSKRPKKSTVILGATMWHNNQLEQEIGKNYWLHIPACAEIIFDIPIMQRWKYALQKAGIKHLYQLPSNMKYD